MFTAIKNTLLLLALLACFTPPAAAQEQEKPERYVNITIVPERTEIAPGESLYVAIVQNIHPGWHTYWINPGDSGEPMTVTWTMPNGFQAQELRWPVPHKQPIGPLVNYGYKDQAAILQEIFIPDELPEGPVTLHAEIALLVCEEICIPEFSSHDVTLNEGLGVDNSAVISAAFDKLPAQTDWKSFYKEEGDNLVITVEAKSKTALQQMAATPEVTFFPYEWGVTDYTVPTYATIGDRYLIIRQKRGERNLLELGKSMGGEIAFTDAAGIYDAYSFTVFPDPEWLKAAQEAAEIQKKTITPAASKKAVSGPASTEIGLGLALLFALLGGLILNLMPCVFPILSMKALSMCELRGKEMIAARLHGLAYTAGILASFAAVAGLLIALKAAGAQIGWGFQLQSPVVVLALGWLLFVIGLNFSGFFTISGSFAGLGGRFLSRHGLFASFLTGVLAVIVATPCTVPFMGAAMGYALTQPASIAISVFMAMGFGLALPYLLLALFPPLQKILPRPGAWMERLKELLAFPIYASSAWLVWVYVQQSGSMALVLALGGMVSFAFALWLLKNVPQGGGGKALTCLLAAAFIIAPVYLGIVKNCDGGKETLPAVTAEAFTEAALAAALQSDAPIFVNMTASWCITCKLNERIALSTNQAQKTFAKHSVRYFKGDWTNYDPAITDFLDRFGRSGVPLYVYYGPLNPETNTRPEPVILPQLLTPGILNSTIEGNKQ